MTASPGFVYEYDAVGNRTWRNRTQQNGGMRCVWDDVNRMTNCSVSSGGATYQYRADGMRTRKVEGLSLLWNGDPLTGSGFYDVYTQVNKPTWRYWYDGQMCVEEDTRANSSQGVQATWTRYGAGARGVDVQIHVPVGSTVETVTFPVYDGHGNVVATLARDGTGYSISNTRAYDAWGNVTDYQNANGHPDNNKRYCGNLGHKQDDESGLIYMRARYYEPTSGRFLSEDPARDGGNWYVYCANDPVGKVDYTGCWEVWIGDYYFRIDMRAPFRDLHIFRNGVEILSKRFDGLPWHGDGGAWTDDIIQTIVRAANQGSAEARNLANRLINGGYGLADDALELLRGAVGGIVVFAISSLDAYAQWDPIDFADTLATIAGAY